MGVTVKLKFGNKCAKIVGNFSLVLNIIECFEAARDFCKNSPHFYNFFYYDKGTDAPCCVRLRFVI